MKKSVIINIIIIVLIIVVTGYILINNSKNLADGKSNLGLNKGIFLNEESAKEIAIEYVNNSNLTYITAKKERGVWIIFLSDEFCKGRYSPLDGCFGGVTVEINEYTRKISSSIVQ